MSSLGAVANGYFLDVIVRATGEQADYGVIALGLIPHGILELPLALLASAMSQGLGREVIRWLLRGHGQVRQRFRHRLRVFAFLIALGLLLVAFIETFITVRILDAVR